MAESIYERNGYADRTEYLNCLSDDYGVSLDIVCALADVLGKGEDFDGLVSELEDISEGY